eukprot:jgi/Mesvir1/21808/Mv04198-RA.1
MKWRQVFAAMDLTVAHLMLALIISALLMPVTSSSDTIFNTEKGHHRQLLQAPRRQRNGVVRLSDWLPQRRARRADAATVDTGPATPAPWVGKDAIADKLWPPGCHLWSVDPNMMQVRSDDGVSKKFLRSLGATDRFPGGYIHTPNKFDGLQLGYAGLAIHDGYALDVWIKGAFPEARMYVLAQGNKHMRPDKNGATWVSAWYLGVHGGTKDLLFHTSSKYHSVNVVTGLKVDALSSQDWHRLTVVMIPHALPPKEVVAVDPSAVVDAPRPRQVGRMSVFINGSAVGTPVNVPVMAHLHLLGNGGDVDNYMHLPWEGMYNAHICTIADKHHQLGPEEAIHNNALQLLALTMKWETAWVAPLHGRSVILVGNSAKILTVRGNRAPTSSPHACGVVSMRRWWQ